MISRFLPHHTNINICDEKEKKKNKPEVPLEEKGKKKQETEF